ncbi:MULTISPECIES: pentapeptide repeat-containing protein [unclassified Coleofasciculus]|uniref:pentapeptide repeat-containing protein n=1 Tax=unclassified Coleofasciculus TaxID=2692782 RepID=UPI001882EF70|nr:MULTISPECIES: pentapeptide repeat-containing protein [unclassified Coleofasciculus]MBE9126400.1 pentapeptide repeat-containing protein [Coleofasciculus sp. LEGE 07081]MBE9149821.1 pentapeptide repeat-containing protein [Coleofasciculus sp. LEGE 07092]
MTSPTVKRVKNQEVSRSFPLRLHRTLPLVTRRCAAFVLEVSLVAGSALVPYSIGLYAKENFTAEPVPLNPMVASTEEAIAKTLAYPRARLNRQVAPLTNLFWCGALVMPVVVVSWQLYLLSKTGQTTPKRWFGVRIVDAYGAHPGLIRAVWREAVGRWGLPVGTAYLLWRYTGAFPDFGILLGLAGFMLLAESASALFHARSRTLHDRLAGTYVLEADRTVSSQPNHFGAWQPVGHNQSVTLEVENGWSSHQETSNGQRRNSSVTTIVLTPKSRPSPPLSLWWWMRRHPGLTLLILSFAGMASVLGTFVGTQVYIQTQANRREFNQQNNEVFLALVKQLSSTSATATEERQGAILALARLNDGRAVPFLVDLLGQEKTPSLIDTIQQALVSKGSEALPALRNLNQSLQNDQKTLQYRGTPEEQQLVALRQRATNRAIAKILTIYSSQIHDADLSRTDLSQVNSGAARFALVLDNLDLAGINFRSAILIGASFKSSRFYGAGEDERLGTFDDWIADLSGAELKEADLTGAVLNNVVMNRTNLIRATLNRANLSDSYLIGANLSSAQLIGADLRRAVLEKASLTGADLGDAKLALSNLHGATLGQASAVGSDFAFADLTQSDWQGADLSGAKLNNSQLQSADLSSTNLTRANLNNAQLQNAKLQNANLSAADLRGANVSGTDFLGATFAAATPVSSNGFITLPPTDTSGARVQGVNFARAKNLDTKQLQYICARGGRHPECP